jgi:hypothetical protein
VLIILEQPTGLAEQRGRNSLHMSLSGATLVAFHLAFGVLRRQARSVNMPGRQ